MKLIALSPIDHDGQRYEEGDELDVTSKPQAEALVACGAALALGAAKAAKKSLAKAKAALEDAQVAFSNATEEGRPAAQAALDQAQAAVAALEA
jgi:nucleotide-binding universal stress UspA family protein